MDQALYTAASAMRSSERRLDMLAHNLANTSTAGYKRKSTATAQFELVTRGQHERVPATISYTDFQQGELRRTGQTYDLALMGEGFFAVDGPRGELYTRGGSFLLDQNGVLVTPEGHPLVWDERFLPIDPFGHEAVIDGQGRVFQGDIAIGRLRVTDFEDPARLVEDTAGYWSAPRGLAERTPTAEVHQGAIEGSNATGMTELIEMVVNQRAYELAANTIQMIDQSYKRLHQPR